MLRYDMMKLVPDGGQKEKVESARANYKAGSQSVLLEPVGYYPHHGQQYLRGRSWAQRHQHQVGQGPVPDRNLQSLLFTISSHHLHCLGLGGDGLYGAHEDVRDDVDSYETVDKSGKVEENS